MCSSAAVDLVIHAPAVLKRGLHLWYAACSRCCLVILARRCHVWEFGFQLANIPAWALAGISGAFWYASGATVQILLFGIMAIEIKRKAPKAHTVLEASHLSLLYSVTILPSEKTALRRCTENILRLLAACAEALGQRRQLGAWLLCPVVGLCIQSRARQPQLLIMFAVFLHACP